MIFFVLFINVGIKWRVIDSIKEILWIGNCMVFNGWSKYLIVLDNFKGGVVSVSSVDIKIINMNW